MFERMGKGFMPDHTAWQADRIVGCSGNPDAGWFITYIWSGPECDAAWYRTSVTYVSDIADLDAVARREAKRITRIRRTERLMA